MLRIGCGLSPLPIRTHSRAHDFLVEILAVEAETYAAGLFTNVRNTRYPQYWLVDSRYDVRSAHAVQHFCYIVYYMYGDAPRFVDSGEYSRADGYTELARTLKRWRYRGRR